ncbi:flagella biosynthesis regulator Flk, partial [Cronobacter sakazakii]
AALRQPLESREWQEISDYAQQRFQATPQTVLTTAQVQDILNQVFIRRSEGSPETLEVRHIQPIYSPLIAFFTQPMKQISAKPGLAMFLLVLVILLLWLVI